MIRISAVFPEIRKYIVIFWYIYYGCLVAKSCLTLVTPRTVAHQALLSDGFPRQEYWSGLPFPPPRDLPKPEIKPASPASPVLQADPSPLDHQGNAVCTHTHTHTSSYIHIHIYLEKEMATDSSVLAWRSPWTGQPGGLLFMGSQRVRHNWAPKHIHIFNTRKSIIYLKN